MEVSHPSVSGGAAASQPLLTGAIVAGLIAAALLIGLSRVYLGVHYPSDVLAGYAAATIWVAGVAFGDRLVSYWRRDRLDRA